MRLFRSPKFVEIIAATVLDLAVTGLLLFGVIDMDALARWVPPFHYLQPLIHPLLGYLLPSALVLVLLRFVSRVIASTNPDRFRLLELMAEPSHIAGYLAMTTMFAVVLFVRSGLSTEPALAYGFMVPAALLLVLELMVGGWAAIGITPPHKRAPVLLVLREQARGVLVILAAGVVVLLGGEVLMTRFTPWQRWPDAVGEDDDFPRNRSFLPDGGILEVTPGTVVQTRLTATRRDATVVSGDAYFQVGNWTRKGHSPWAPLEIAVGPVTVTAPTPASTAQPRDNSFLIHHEGDHIEVLVNAGAGVMLRVAAARTPTGQPLRTPALWSVRSGMRAVVDNGRVQVQPMTLREREHRFAWTGGVLQYQGESLADAVKEMNLFTERKLVIADPTIAEKPVAGEFWLRFPNLAERFVVGLEEAQVARQIPATEPHDLTIRLVDFAADPARYGSAEEQRDHDKCANYSVDHPAPAWMGSYPNDNDTRWTFDIPACDLRGALIAFHEQSGVRYLFAVDEPVLTHAVEGQYTAQQALDILLKGTNCQASGSTSQMYITCPVRTAELNARP